MKVILEVGDTLTNSEGIYLITGLYEKGGTVVTVKECIYVDTDGCIVDDNEIYFTKEEVLRCLKFEHGVSVKFEIKKKINGR